MKRFFVGLVCSMLLIACGGSKTGVTEDVVPADSVQTTSVDSTANDSIADLLEIGRAHV